MNAQRHPRAMKASTPIPGRRREALGGAFRVARESYRPQLQRCISPACSASTGETGSILGVGDVGRLAPDPVKAWWYFRGPMHPGETMQEDLEAAGLE